MLNIVVVDDEERIRLGLGKLIRQAGEHYRVVGQFASGSDLLEQMEALKPDLIITDVKMPRMNGLQLMEKVKEGGWPAKVAVLSGYDDFHFVREALRQGAVEYLLKPVDLKELQRLLEHVHEQTELERGEDPLEAEKLLSFLLCSDEKRMTRQLFEEVCARLDRMPLLRQHYAVLLMRNMPMLPDGKLQQLMDERWGERRIIPYDAGRLAVLLPIGQLDHPQSVREKAVMLMQCLPAGTRAKIGISDVYCGSRWLPQAMLEAEQSFEHAWYSREMRSCSDGKRCKTAKEERLRLLRMVDQELIPALQLGESGPAIAIVNRWLDDSERLRLSWEELREGCSDLEALIAEALKQRSLHIAEEDAVFPEAYENWEAFAEALRRNVAGKAAAFEASSHENRAVEKIKQYILEHYTEELELQRLAEFVFLTPSYLSKLFKTETGETITDYIISVRIQQAKLLLRRDHNLKTYEIGERVGYADPAYFTKVFKKTTGKTPKEYRDLVR
ncbi:response regulator [Paenibacillus protaetiae]|uniref:Response regulator n=1 Tax=Paenibacillus protaetiae TaxID=2509456 RepID=A0A4P6EYR0_9BACL|nr:response regulator [Paenibacillus protaetiae]QAY67996.1 response regulator [Paenibacillus protaetiae]